MNINIEPVETISQITSIKIDVQAIILNERAIIRVLMYNVNYEIVKSETFELTQPDYSLWLTDENLINYVCEKYNFVRT